MADRQGPAPAGEARPPRGRLGPAGEAGPDHPDFRCSYSGHR